MTITGLTVGIKVVLFFLAVIAGGAAFYGIAKAIKPDFDKDLWK